MNKFIKTTIISLSLLLVGSAPVAAVQSYGETVQNKTTIVKTDIENFSSKYFLTRNEISNILKTTKQLQQRDVESSDRNIRYFSSSPSIRPNLYVASVFRTGSFAGEWSAKDISNISTELGGPVLILKLNDDVLIAEVGYGERSKFVALRKVSDALVIEVALEQSPKYQINKGFSLVKKLLNEQYEKYVSLSVVS